MHQASEASKGNVTTYIDGEIETYGSHCQTLTECVIKLIGKGGDCLLHEIIICKLTQVLSGCG